MSNMERYDKWEKLEEQCVKIFGSRFTTSDNKLTFIFDRTAPIQKFEQEVLYQGLLDRISN